MKWQYISTICQSILTHEVLKCEKLNFKSVDNLYFTENENSEIAVSNLYCSETVQYISI